MTNSKDNSVQQDRTEIMTNSKDSSVQQDKRETSQEADKKKEGFEFEEKDMYKVTYDF